MLNFREGGEEVWEVAGERCVVTKIFFRMGETYWWERMVERERLKARSEAWSIQVQEWGPPPIPHPGPLYLTLKSQRVSFEASHFHLPARNKLIELLTQLQGVIRFKKGLAGASMINYWWKNWLGVCLCPSWIDLFVFFRLEQLLVPIVFLQPDGSILFSSFKINSGFIYVLGKKDFFFFFTSVMES